MFTGLILDTGSIARVEKLGPDLRLAITPKHFKTCFSDLSLGESIAVNGVCLSVERINPQSFWVYASAETLACTTIATFKEGQSLNLERALAVGERLGGHIVSGHVDGVAQIVFLKNEGASLRLKIAYPQALASQIVAKGSVALDGISLTVNACTKSTLEVNLIPDTQKQTTVGSWQVGDKLNLETDLLAKYVERFLSIRSNEAAKAQKASHVNFDFLLQNGFA
ncbi:MAG: riboflavin synthase [Desulfovibrio sp.]|nr:riboflavin synthase [Desulfovibrio sp.]